MLLVFLPAGLLASYWDVGIKPGKRVAAAAARRLTFSRRSNVLSRCVARIQRNNIFSFSFGHRIPFTQGVHSAEGFSTYSGFQHGNQTLAAGQHCPRPDDNIIKYLIDNFQTDM